jgi:CHAT domain-containing protein
LGDSKGNLDEALTLLSKAVLMVEKLRPQTGGGQLTQAKYLEEYQDMFETMVKWQLEGNKLREAVSYLERGKARLLLDQLTASGVDIRKSIPFDLRIELEKRESQALARLMEYQQRIYITQSRKDLSSEQMADEILRLQSLLANARDEFQQVYEETMNASALWRDIITRGGQPVDLIDLQQTVLSKSSRMLIYQIGDEESHLFAIFPQNESIAVMPLYCNDIAAAMFKIAPGPLTTTKVNKLMLGEEDGMLNLMSGQASSPEMQKKLYQLWKVLIPESLWERIKQSPEVIVIPDGGLFLLPFETLIVEKTPPHSPIRYWLDEGPAVRYAPSATILYNLERNSTAGVRSDSSAFVLSLSDPVFDMSKVTSEIGREIASKDVGVAAEDSLRGTSDDLLRDDYEDFGGPLIRLKNTAKETERIQAAFNFSIDNNPVMTLIRFDATEANLRHEIQGKKYVHIATHGFVYQDHNFLFSSLALTPPALESPNPEDDGFLQLHEIYALNLKACELAVLSACKSNNGLVFEGEGVLGLSRGFLAAGAQRVIASQWSVADASTAELVATLFDEIAQTENERRNPDYSLALRNAKLKIRNNERWASPFHWAPFVLIGKK